MNRLFSLVTLALALAKELIATYDVCVFRVVLQMVLALWNLLSEFPPVFFILGFKDRCVVRVFHSPSILLKVNLVLRGSKTKGYPETQNRVC